MKIFNNNILMKWYNENDNNNNINNNNNNIYNNGVMAMANNIIMYCNNDNIIDINGLNNDCVIQLLLMWCTIVIDNSNVLM